MEEGAGRIPTDQLFLPPRVLTEKYPSPAYFLTVVCLITAAIFSVEILLMAFVYYLSPFSSLGDTIFDALVLTAVLFPMLYFLLYRPLVLHIRERLRAEEALRKSHELLEQRVMERTAELAAVNEKLRALSSHILTAQEEERKRLSMELHDQLGQDLAVLKLHVRSIKKKLPQDQVGLHGSCEETLHYVDQIIENVRRLHRDLSPPVLEDLGLTDAIRSLVDEFSKYYQISISAEIEAVESFFPETLKINLYRILQEALTNIGKHAYPTQVRVEVRHTGGQLLLDVEDDGKGFDPRAISGKDRAERGLGLAHMEERAWMLGGNLRVASREGQGTRISVAIPLDRAGGAE